MTLINIKDLSLRTIIGVSDWERQKKQDVIINITIEYDAAEAVKKDNFDLSLDYKSVTKQVINEVEKSHFFLLETLADCLIKKIMENKRVINVTVEVDKPHSLRFVESVSIIMSAKREA